MMLEQFHALAPEAFEALERLEDEIDRADDLPMMVLCRVRVRQLLGVPTQAELGVEAIVKDWPRSSALSEIERACLAFTEHFFIDVSSITNDEVAPLLQLLGPAGLYRFTYALSAVDQIERLRVSLPSLIRMDA